MSIVDKFKKQLKPSSTSAKNSSSHSASPMSTLNHNKILPDPFSNNHFMNSRNNVMDSHNENCLKSTSQYVDKNNNPLLILYYDSNATDLQNVNCYDMAVKINKLGEIIFTQDVNILINDDIPQPSWLTKTPTIVDASDDETIHLHYPDSCELFLQNLHDSVAPKMARRINVIGKKKNNKRSTPQMRLSASSLVSKKNIDHLNTNAQNNNIINNDKRFSMK
jgi:hypothetical protein